MKLLFIFIGGMAVGAAALYLYFRITAPSIETEEECLSEEMKEDMKEPNKKQSITYTKPEVIDYDKAAVELGYAAKSNEDNTKKDGPYLITQDEFEENEEYEKVCYTYYTDGIVALYDDEIIEHPEDHIGTEILTNISAEDDAIFVRNDEEKVDYEIDIDCGSYMDIVGKRILREDY